MKQETSKNNPIPATRAGAPKRAPEAPTTATGANYPERKMKGLAWLAALENGGFGFGKSPEERSPQGSHLVRGYAQGTAAIVRTDRQVPFCARAILGQA
ncbi:uncharacterized protein N7518_008203 [Penicillium psychrosexuale]|uniref:uncharacterized protein n=1 Tax=Penicillium psychrosexuale TaxID=1002107 RepID=UPI0025455374|nr:uncharacterized protein N7518_008203 [Penicillium psychrosexuale]KAJ5791192.1 hypothetical protein N7518_008203 [Penicillium psychrosexuale]